MKRIALLVTALLLLAMFAVACGGTTEQTVDEAANAAATTVDEAANGAMDNANEAMDNANEALDNANEATGETAGSGDCSDADVLCVGLVTDVGEVDDKSFNQSAWEGAQQAAQDLGAAEVNYVETKDAKDYGANIDLFATQGYDIIVTVGFAMGEATIAAAETYPDIYFIGVDQFQGDTVPNLAGLVFNEDQAGYLAGVLAASMSESGTIASVLGTDWFRPLWPTTRATRMARCRSTPTSRSSTLTIPVVST